MNLGDGKRLWALFDLWVLRAEFLISVALIAVARHVIHVDYEHTSPSVVIALAFLVLTLAAAYVSMRRWTHSVSSQTNPVPRAPA